MNKNLMLFVFLPAIFGCGTSQEEMGGFSTPLTSRPQAERPIAFVPYGYVEGSRVSFERNATLVYEQSREHCDEQRVEVESKWVMPKCVKQMEMPWSVRSLKLMLGQNTCAQYENIPGQAHPKCKRYNQRYGSCAEFEEPAPPPPAYRSKRVCYQTPAGRDVVGKLKIYAIPPGATPSSVSSHRLVAMVNLDSDGASSKIDLAGKVIEGECLAAADVAGKTLRVRDDEGDAFLFATPHMQARSDERVLDRKMAESRGEYRQAKERAASIRTELEASVAYHQGNCRLPAMREKPPEPRGPFDAEPDPQAFREWREEVRRIEREPQLQMRLCQMKIRDLENAEGKMKQIEEAAQAAADNFRATSIKPSSMPISDARCTAS